MKTLMYWFDFTIGYMLTSSRNLPYYHRYMWEEYGTWYCTNEQFQQYWDSLAYLDDEPC